MLLTWLQFKRFHICAPLHERENCPRHGIVMDLVVIRIILHCVGAVRVTCGVFVPEQVSPMPVSLFSSGFEQVIVQDYQE